MNDLSAVAGRAPGRRSREPRQRSDGDC